MKTRMLSLAAALAMTFTASQANAFVVQVGPGLPIRLVTDREGSAAVLGSDRHNIAVGVSWEGNNPHLYCGFQFGDDCSAEYQWPPPPPPCDDGWDILC